MPGSAASPEVVAKAVCHAAIAKRPKARYGVPTKTRFRMIMAHLPAAWQDWLIRQALRSADER